MQIDIFDQIGKKVSKHTLTSEVFEARINLGLVHLAVTIQQGNKRQATAKAKTKGDVRGGGRKPYRQKGTGRARAGSTRSPLWRGGGVTFGPTGIQNYKRTLTKKQKRLALFSVLSQKAKEDNIIGLKSFDTKGLKTKKVNEILEKLPIKRNALIVIPDNNIDIKRSCLNIPFVKVSMASYISVYDLLKYETVLILTESFSVIDKTWKEEAKTLIASRTNTEIGEAKKTVKPKKKAAEKPVIKKEVKAEVKKVVEVYLYDERKPLAGEYSKDTTS